MVQVAATTRFLDSHAGADWLGIGPQVGENHSTSLTSGGQVLSVELEPAVLESLYRSHSVPASGDYLDEAAQARFQVRDHSSVRVGAQSEALSGESSRRVWPRTRPGAAQW